MRNSSDCWRSCWQWSANERDTWEASVRIHHAFHLYVCMLAWIGVCMFVYVNVNVYTHIHHANRYTYIFTYLHTNTHKHTQRTQTHANPRKHSQTHTKKHTKQTQTHTHTRAHAHTHTRTHTYERSEVGTCEWMFPNDSAVLNKYKESRDTKTSHTCQKMPYLFSYVGWHCEVITLTC